VEAGTFQIASQEQCLAAAPGHRVSGETRWRERQRHATDGAEAATRPRTPTSIQRRRRRPLDPSPSGSPGEPGFTAVAVGEIQITGGPLTLRFRGRWTSIGSTRRCPPCIPIAAARRASRVGADRAWAGGEPPEPSPVFRAREAPIICIASVLREMGARDDFAWVQGS
jgi:hypothetical protein